MKRISLGSVVARFVPKRLQAPAKKPNQRRSTGGLGMGRLPDAGGNGLAGAASTGVPATSVRPGARLDSPEPPAKAEAPPETIGGRFKTTRPSSSSTAPPVATLISSSGSPVPADLATRLGIKQCKAIDADTGRRCGLLEHDGEGHASARGAFTRVAAPGQTDFELHRRLDAAGAVQREPTLGGRGRCWWIGEQTTRAAALPRAASKPAPGRNLNGSD